MNSIVHQSHIHVTYTNERRVSIENDLLAKTVNDIVHYLNNKTSAWSDLLAHAYTHKYIEKRIHAYDEWK